MKKKNALQVRLARISEEDSKRIGATIDLAEAMTAKDIRQRLSSLEKNYAKMLARILELRRLPQNSITKWKIADQITFFLNATESSGIDLESHLKVLTRDTGLSRTVLKYLVKFRSSYSFEELDASIPWSWAPSTMQPRIFLLSQPYIVSINQ